MRLSKRLQIAQLIIYGCFLVLGIILSVIKDTFICGIGGFCITFTLTGFISFAFNRRCDIHKAFKVLFGIFGPIFIIGFVIIHSLFITVNSYFYGIYIFTLILTFIILMILRIVLVKARCHFIFSLIIPFIVLLLGLLFGKVINIITIMTTVIIIGIPILAAIFSSNEEKIRERHQVIATTDGHRYVHMYDNVYKDDRTNERFLLKEYGDHFTLEKL